MEAVGDVDDFEMIAADSVPFLALRLLAVKTEIIAAVVAALSLIADSEHSEIAAVANQAWQ